MPLARARPLSSVWARSIPPSRRQPWSTPGASYLPSPQLLRHQPPIDPERLEDGPELQADEGVAQREGQRRGNRAAPVFQHPALLGYPEALGLVPPQAGHVAGPGNRPFAERLLGIGPHLAGEHEVVDVDPVAAGEALRADRRAEDEEVLGEGAVQDGHDAGR